MKNKNILFISVSLVLIVLLGIGVFYSMWNKKDLLQEFFKLHIIDINNMPKHASYA